MFTQKLDCGYDFEQAHLELSRLEGEAGKQGYKPHMMKIVDAEAYKTYQQIKVINAIIGELYKTGSHSCPVDKITLADFREYVKSDVIMLFEDINIWIPKKGFAIRRRCKSMAKYAKREMTQAIELVLAYVLNCGCNSKKMEEIISGMEKGKIGKRI